MRKIPWLASVRYIHLHMGLTLAVVPAICRAQIKDPWKGKPDSIEESFLYFDQMFDDTAKYTFATFPEDMATLRLHHGFGRWMRNNWGLWGSGRLKRELLDSGFVHPDDMSGALLTAYHRKIHNKPLGLKEQAEASMAYWSAMNADGFSSGDLGIDQEQHTSLEDLCMLFPVGDTIVVSIYATYKKFFKEYGSSVRGTAIVRSRSGADLNVELLAIERSESHEPERQVGDVFEISPVYCYLIPPKGWKPKPP